MTRPLRIVLMAVAVFVAGVGTAGLVQGGSDTSVLAPPELRIGDRAIYRVDLQGLPHEMLFDEMRVAWEAPERILDRDGRPTWARPLLIERAGYDEGQQQPYLYVQRSYFAINGSHLRSQWEGPLSGQDVHLAQEVPAAQATGSYRDVVFAMNDTSTPCGLRGPGRPVGPGVGIELQGRCGGSPAFSWLGFRQAGDLRAWAYAAQHDPRLEVWYVPGIPFPVRILMPVEHLVEGWQGPAGRAVFVMTAQERGGAVYDEPVLREAKVDRTGPRTPWGLDEAGVDHPFPLSAAFRLARVHAGERPLGEYLSQHPGAYTAIAWYNGYVAPGEEWHHAWWFLVTDGDSYVAKNVVRRESMQPGILPEPLQATVEVQDVRWQEHPEHVRGVLPPPHLVPDTLPTVQAVHEAYRALRSGHLDGMAPTRWSLNVKCGDTDCSTAFAVVTGGYYEARWDLTSGLSPAPVHPGVLLDAPSHREGSVTMLGDGRVVHYTEQVKQDGLAPIGSAIRAEGEPEPYEVPQGSPAGWSLPTPGAGAAAGAAALLVAGIYAAWPYLKAGALGMFSRIQRHQALEHPVRRAILDAVQAEPGLHFQQIVRRVHGGRGATKHHLEKLVETGLLCCTTGNGYTCYFVPGAVDRGAMAAWPFAKSRGARRLLAALDGEPASCRVLARRLGMAPSTVSTHLRRLEAQGLLARSGDLFHATPKTRQLLDRA